MRAWKGKPLSDWEFQPPDGARLAKIPLPWGSMAAAGDGGVGGGLHFPMALSCFAYYNGGKAGLRIPLSDQK